MHLNKLDFLFVSSWEWVPALRRGADGTAGWVQVACWGCAPWCGLKPRRGGCPGVMGRPWLGWVLRTHLAVSRIQALRGPALGSGGWQPPGGHSFLFPTAAFQSTSRTWPHPVPAFCLVRPLASARIGSGCSPPQALLTQPRPLLGAEGLPPGRGGPPVTGPCSLPLSCSQVWPTQLGPWQVRCEWGCLLVAPPLSLPPPSCTPTCRAGHGSVSKVPQ